LQSKTRFGIAKSRYVDTIIMKILLFISIIASITEAKKFRMHHKFDKRSMISKSNSKYTKHTTKRNQSPDVILTNHILSQVLKKKIFTEIASDSCILQIFDCFNPFSMTILIITTFSSLTNMNDTKLMTFRRKNPKIVYRCLDFLLLVVVIVLSRNVKNAI
jgi:hypothetical protein